MKSLEQILVDQYNKLLGPYLAKPVTLDDLASPSGVHHSAVSFGVGELAGDRGGEAPFHEGLDEYLDAQESAWRDAQGFRSMGERL